MAALPKRRRFNVVEYYRMADAGILDEDDRVELIRGEIIEMPPIGVGHASVVDRANRLFVFTFRDSVVVRIQNPLRISARDEPVPDLMLLKPRTDFYRERHPMPEDVLLLVEVSDTTLSYDRDKKLPLYAMAGVPEVWIVDLKAQVVRVFLHPVEGHYRDTRTAGHGDHLAPLAFPDMHLAVNDILGEPAP